MDKNAIKKYAIWARRELLDRVSQRAMIFGITAKDAGDPDAESVNGRLLTPAEKQQRQALIHNIKEKGYEQVMEEVAYTWFNRFAALRFMEVNGYLPSHIRVFTNDAGEFKPQILAEAIHLDLVGLNMNRVYELESANKSEELFKYLLIVQCNALNSILPGMFQRIDDYTELLFPDYLLREGSVIEQMVTAIPESDWTDQVQIIGWLYQYYNTEPKDKVFADLKKNIKITRENIPAATQLFTPDWIVHYMVENSLGRLWLEGHPNDALKSEWKYYLDEAQQEPEVQARLDEIRKEYAALKPEEIRVIDPCMGSGHILCVLFDVLVRIYEDYGYTAREAATKIVENNLWGLDIDERAAQLSYFTVMMKARQYDRRFFTHHIQPHIYAIVESNAVEPNTVEYFCKGDPGLKKAIQTILDELYDAREYGSILTCSAQDWNALYARLDEISEDIAMHRQSALELLPLVKTAEVLAQQYDVVVTNPPYMGGSGMDAKLSEFVKKNYPDSKSDMFAVFIEKCGAFAKQNGYFSMITQHAWMFLSSYEKLREKMRSRTTINMAHLGARAFDEIGGEVVQTTAFVNSNTHIVNYLGVYERLIDGMNEKEKEELFLSGQKAFMANAENFSKIPGAPVAYWVSNNFIKAFSYPAIESIAKPRQGLITGNNDLFLRYWFEVTLSDGHKWKKFNKNVDYRKWYGNYLHFVNWEDEGYEIKHYFHENGRLASRPQNISTYFKRGITFPRIGSASFYARYCPENFIYDVNAPMSFTEKDKEFFILALYCSKVTMAFISVLAPTISFQIGDIEKIPVKMPDNHEILNLVNELVEENIKLSRADWDSFETSWDFKAHPLIPNHPGSYAATPPKEGNGEEIPLLRRGAPEGGGVVRNCYAAWEHECEERFQKLKRNEEELNRIFIDIYGLQDELTPEVEDKDVTVRRADLQREVRSLISYAVGCMFGRYSLDFPGLVYAGGAWDPSKYRTFQADPDGIIPICDDEYFEDDIVGRFVTFVELVYGKDTLEDNLHFIADALGGRGSSREVIRNYFINDFYADHLKVYQKRPIYWLFDSGKKNGFKCLIYLHRYQPDTIARIRTDYVHEQQSRYRTALADLEQRINGATTSERVKLSKRLAILQAQAEEIRLYEEKIHHLADQMIKIDLDDGVKVNYAKFEDVLAKIK